MSKAFTNEETPDDPIVPRPRAPLPVDAPNYVTRRGIAQLRRELADLEHARGSADAAHGSDTAAHGTLSARINELAARIGSAVVLESQAASDEVRFGAWVSVRDAAGDVRRYQIVGVDEANAKEGRVAFVAPLARALLGRRLGEGVSVTTPRGETEYEIVAIEAPPEGDG